MPTWNTLKNYITSNYKISNDDGGLLSLVFAFDDGRSQMVLVEHSKTQGGIEFATITSPFAKVGEVDISEVLVECGRQVVGGVVTQGDYHVVKHSVLLDTLDADDFDVPLRLVTTTAEYLEEKFLGTDRF